MNEISLTYDFRKIDDNKKFDNDFIEKVKKTLGETVSEKNYLVSILLRIIKINAN